MKKCFSLLVCLAVAIAGPAHVVKGAGIESIQNIVVIYAENRSFDNLYGSFSGANGLSGLTPDEYTQRDRDGSVLNELPPIWGGLTAEGVLPVVRQEQTEHLANAPLAIDDPKGFKLPLGVATRDLWHRFYQNQMQIAGGKNDRFAAFADSGGLVMGHYANARLPLWEVAQQYVLADNFFMGAFGGSFLNHFMLIFQSMVAALAQPAGLNKPPGESRRPHSYRAKPGTGFSRSFVLVFTGVNGLLILK